ncbi:MAG: hypothetical protein ACK4KW_12380 [Gemmobacter sp.]
MIRKSVPLLAAIGLSACSGNPINFGTGPVEPAPPPGEIGEEIVAEELVVPAILRQNLNGYGGNPGAATITVSLASLDGSPVNATYARDPALDLNGFAAYSVQEATTQRKFVALVQRSASGRSEALVVADGGQFVNYFGGGEYSRNGAFNLPASGLASYGGNYVGVLNFGDSTPGGPGGALDPAQSFRVTGRILINADFNDFAINGGIDNRSIVETATPLDPQFLEVTQINAQGAFAGVTKFDSRTPSGNYGGIFAGPNAGEVAGVVVLRPLRNEALSREHGAFVLPRCAAGSASPCP